MELGGGEGQVTGVVLLTGFCHSFSDYLNQHSFASASIELGIEDSLPWSQVEPSRGDRHDDLVVNQHRFEMRVAIGLSGLMVFVGGIPGRECLQPGFDIVDQSGFVVVDVDPGGDVHGGDQREALLDSALAHDFLHLRRDVYVLMFVGSVEGEIFSVRFHVRSVRQNRYLRMLQQV